MRWLLLLTTLLFLAAGSNVSAHSGRTDSNGCHNCYTSYCYGEYHCHGGGGGGYGGYIAPVSPKNPIGQASHTFIPHPSAALYDIYFDWEETTPRSYSIAISKTAGGDPGPLVDTTETQYLFEDITPGRWYVNMKASVGNQWSEVVYWTIDVPKWVEPTPIPTRKPTPTPPGSNESSDDNSWLWLGAAAVGYLIYYKINNRRKKPEA